MNALLQRQAYTSAEFDTLADSLAIERRKPWFHPHRSVFGMGDYDANVLLFALEKEGCSTKWLTEKDDISSMLQLPSLFGFLVNVEGRHWMQKVIDLFVDGTRHWIAVSRYQDGFYLVDSKSAAARKMATEDEVVDFFRKVRAQMGHILSVAKPDIG